MSQPPKASGLQTSYHCFNLTRYVTKLKLALANVLLAVMVLSASAIAQDSARDQFVELVAAVLISKGILEERDLTESQLQCAVGEFYDLMSDEQKGLSQLVTEQAAVTPETDPLEVDSDVSEKYDPGGEISSSLSSLASDSHKDEIHRKCGVLVFE